MDASVAEGGNRFTRRRIRLMDFRRFEDRPFGVVTLVVCGGHRRCESRKAQRKKGEVNKGLVMQLSHSYLPQKFKSSKVK